MIGALQLGICLSIALSLAQTADAACVENATDRTLFFTIEARAMGLRRGAWLEPGGVLCLPAAQHAVFTAFASDTSVEGCPRLAGADGKDRLLAFLPTDACRWASHGR